MGVSGVRGRRRRARLIGRPARNALITAASSGAANAPPWPPGTRAKRPAVSSAASSSASERSSRSPITTSVGVVIRRRSSSGVGTTPSTRSSARGSAPSSAAQCAIWASAEPGGRAIPSASAVSARRFAPPPWGGDLREPLPGHDGATGLGASREHAHHDPAAERVTAEVVLARAEPEVPDEGERVVGEHVGRIRGQIVRSRALPVTAEVGQDEAEWGVRLPDPRRGGLRALQRSAHAAWTESERLRCHCHRRRSGSPWWLLQNRRLSVAVQAILLCACQRADRLLPHGLGSAGCSRPLGGMRQSAHAGTT